MYPEAEITENGILLLAGLTITEKKTLSWEGKIGNLKKAFEGKIGSVKERIAKMNEQVYSD